MSDPFAKVSPGQRLAAFPAALYNAMIDVSQAHRRRMATEPGVSLPAVNDGQIIQIKNTTAAELPRFGVVGLGDPVFPPDDAIPVTLNEIAFAGVAPQVALHAGGRVAIALAAIAPDAIGLAQIDGVVLCKIKGDAEPASIRHADVEDAATGYLVPAGSGVQVLWVADAVEPEEEEEAPARWAIVRLSGGGSDSFPARITSASSGAHAWTELQATSDGSYQNLPGGRTGTTSENPAYEINGRANVPANTIVWVTAARNDEGLVKYLFDLGTGNPGSVSTMTYSGQHPENASTNTWDINNQTDNRGISVTLQTGTRYDPSATTPTLYAYLRTFTFDASGHLTGVSTESRVVIDTPEDCS